MGFSMVDIEKNTAIAICVYNNFSTIRLVAEKCLALTSCDVVIVDDGSTDGNVKELLKDLPRTRILVHKKNLGKGAALQTALHFLSAHHPEKKWMLTLDADGQHFPEDIPNFLSALKKTQEENILFIGTRDFSSGKGEIPAKSILGKTLSDFCIRLETKQKITDSQSGFRCYPVYPLRKIACKSSRYAWETEILVRALWQGIKVIHIPVQVEYFTKETRVTHFKVWKDNLRIIALHLGFLWQLLLNGREKSGK
ncbi:MAG: glycosyltransferase family 2 protein [Lentisphaeria bacterium]|nr:glycosyltransferase family 2 protein [Lentisphaeria bacterium]